MPRPRSIASKNNAPDVEEVFASHPHMMLKKDHFAQAQIDWGPKSESLVEIARRRPTWISAWAEGYGW